jgi:hypothetical protein
MVFKSILIGLYILNLGIILAKHGQSKTGEYNAWHTFIAGVIATTLIILI